MRQSTQHMRTLCVNQPRRVVSQLTSFTPALEIDFFFFAVRSYTVWVPPRGGAAASVCSSGTCRRLISFGAP